MAFLDFYKLDLMHLIIIAFSSLIISIIVSYYTLETDIPLTTNYFE